jgi:hypothetical protein
VLGTVRCGPHAIPLNQASTPHLLAWNTERNNTHSTVQAAKAAAEALVGVVHARLSAGLGPTAQRDGGAAAEADAAELPMAGGAVCALSLLLGDCLLWTVLALQV